jgi:ABC-type dipeptide/oligopeptide/nickel transport system permease subunit
LCIISTYEIRYDHLPGYLDGRHKSSYPIRFFVQGWEYKLLGLIPTKLHLFGVDEGGTIYILGTDKMGRDLWGKACEAGASRSA